VITLVVFTGFSMLYLKEPLTWNVGISHSGTMTVTAITALPATMDVYRSMLMAATLRRAVIAKRARASKGNQVICIALICSILRSSADACRPNSTRLQTTH
jgi:hypothetical protein